MNFTGKNLVLVRDGLRYALAEIHNQIATCPNVDQYADEIEELEAEHEKIKKLLARIHARHPELLDGDDDAS